MIIWSVLLHDDFHEEVDLMCEGLQDELFAHAKLLTQFGPILGRPTVDTLKGSRHANLKELRFTWAGEVWRVAFAFDTQREAILLIGGNKVGTNQRKFYRWLIAGADDRFDKHLATFESKVIKK
jgi:hypothetical protein